MSQELLDIAKRRLYPNYRPAPFVPTRGEGCVLFDGTGHKWLDLCAGVAVSTVGHAHPKLVAAIEAQAARVIHLSNYFYNEPNIRLADELCKRTGFSRAFFCNSGTEANEALLKLALHHFYGKGDKKRTRVIAFDGAFHGRTMGALAMTGTPKYREGFGEFTGVTHVPYGDLEAVKQAMADDVCAIIVEPVLGEGGVVAAPPGFLAGLREIATDGGALYFIDEIQTGVGRTGKFLAHEGETKPDAVSMAKALGGGIPIGAMLTTEELASALPPGTHGSTFGGNALACATALEVLKILDDENLVEGAKIKGEALGKMLDALAKELPEVCEGARGVGLLRGLVLKKGLVARDLLPKLFDAGVLLIAAGENVIRFAPPLIITEDELKTGVQIVRNVLSELKSA
ncbi:MAG: acetylornithine/succinylornithine family transaminase [Polyangiaceae bacterium]